MWNKSSPPTDGTPIVAIGSVVESGDDGGCSQPFCAAVFWNDKAGWCYWVGEYHHLSVADHPDQKVNIGSWLPFPTK